MEIKLAAVVLVFGASAPNVHVITSAQTPRLVAMPWLHGLHAATVSDAPTRAPDEVEPLDPAPDEAGCVGQDHGLELTADVAPTPGRETVRASFTHGILVRGAEGNLVASAPGYPCEGSADEVTALAAGRTVGDATIALAVTHGGHQEQTTDLALFRVGFGGRLDPVFTAEVERRQGDLVRQGDVWLIPGALIYQRPGGRRSLWVFDPAGRAYTHRITFAPSSAPPHVEPRS